MFDQLTQQFSKIFEKFRSKGIITTDDIKSGMREIRIALLEADVALPVVKELITSISEKALGEEVLNSIKPTDMLLKIVHDELIGVLTSENTTLNITKQPSIMILVGLQGVGKTTATAKLANFVKKDKKVLLVPLDRQRAAAVQQLQQLGEQIKVEVLNSNSNDPLKIASLALEKAKKEHFDIVIADTAGRLHTDDALMLELKNLQKILNPQETLLVTDILSGQDAFKVANEFKNAINLTGIILSRVDSDTRGGAALSVKHITKCPIKFLSTGEKVDQLEAFDPERIVARMLDKGDMASLIENINQKIKEDEAKQLENSLKTGRINFQTMLLQFRQIKKVGGISSLVGMLPGMSGLKEKLGNQDHNMELKRNEAIILSMTVEERLVPEVLNASRKKRIASGSGTEIVHINRLLKQHKKVNKMMRKFGKLDKAQLSQALKSLKV